MKVTDVFDRLDNTLANYQEGKASTTDVINMATEVNKYLIQNTHPHDVLMDKFLDTTNMISKEELQWTIRSFEKAVEERDHYEKLLYKIYFMPASFLTFKIRKLIRNNVPGLKSRLTKKIIKSNLNK